MNEQHPANIQAPSVITKEAQKEGRLSRTHREVKSVGSLPGARSRGSSSPSSAIPRTHLLPHVVKLQRVGLPGRPVLLLPLQIPVEDIQGSRRGAAQRRDARGNLSDSKVLPQDRRRRRSAPLQPEASQPHLFGRRLLMACRSCACAATTSTTLEFCAESKQFGPFREPLRRSVTRRIVGAVPRETWRRFLRGEGCRVQLEL